MDLTENLDLTLVEMEKLIASQNLLNKKNWVLFNF
jgi:hypothetical protein